MAYSDEPVLVRPTSRPIGRYVAIGAIFLLLALLAYIPWQKQHMDERAHDVDRGPRGGASYDVTIGGQPHQISLGWVRGPVFAITLTPAPATGTTLKVKSSFGEETLAWNDELQAFGPGTLSANPYEHYKLKLSLMDASGTVLWSDTRWAFGVVSGHQH